MLRIVRYRARGFLVLLGDARAHVVAKMCGAVTGAALAFVLLHQPHVDEATLYFQAESFTPPPTAEIKGWIYLGSLCTAAGTHEDMMADSTVNVCEQAWWEAGHMAHKLQGGYR